MYLKYGTLMPFSTLRQSPACRREGLGVMEDLLRTLVGCSVERVSPARRGRSVEFRLPRTRRSGWGFSDGVGSKDMPCRTPRMWWRAVVASLFV